MANTTERATCWSVTINNPTESDHEAIALARQKGWTVTGQLEKGVEGTYHYQLMVRTPQLRFSAMKKQFDRAHIEVARDPAALSKYVRKEATREGELPSGLKYPSMSQLWRLIYTRNNTNEKDGWDVTELPHTVRLYADHMARFMDEVPLEWFDMQIRALIADGFHVETLAVNPQVRACWKNYHGEILLRACHEELISQQENTANEDAPEVQVPPLDEEEVVSQAPDVSPEVSTDSRPAEPRHSE